MNSGPPQLKLRKPEKLSNLELASQRLKIADFQWQFNSKTMNSRPPEPKLWKPEVLSCLAANSTMLFLTHGIHRLPYSPFAYILCQDNIAYKSWHEKSKRRIMIVTQSLKQSLHALLLTQPVKDVCACVEVQDEELQLLQAQAQGFKQCQCLHVLPNIWWTKTCWKNHGRHND